MTVTNDMIEAAAKAMCAADGADWDALSVNETANGEEPEEQREYWRHKAEAALAAARQDHVEPQPWKAREGFRFDLDDEMLDRLNALAHHCEKQGVGILATANYHGQGQVNVPAAWLLELISGYRSRRRIVETQVDTSEGWRLVPVEPTHEMLAALWEAMILSTYDGSQAPMAGAGYDAALATSPTPPADADLKADEPKQAPCGIADPSARDCQNMKEVGGGMDGERYHCAVCGKGYYLDYEDMK